MTRLSKLTRAANEALAGLNRYFPRYDHNDVYNPRQVNAIFPEYEWNAERPQQLGNGRQDWHHVFVADTTSGDRVEVFFERLVQGVAVVWALLVIDGRKFTLHEQCHRDHSNVSAGIYSAGGIRLECDAPMRFWRLAINAFMEEELSAAEPEDLETLNEADKDKATNSGGVGRVHVRFGGRWSSMSHPFEIPAQCPASEIARIYVGIDDVEQAKLAIQKCCSCLQAYIQAITVFSEIQIGANEKLQRVLFGSRLRCMGDRDILKGKYIGSNAVLHHTGYAANGLVFHAIELTDAKWFGFCFSPTTFDVPAAKGRIQRQTTATSLNAPLQIVFMSSEYWQTIDLTYTSFVSRSRLDSRPGYSNSWFVKEARGELYHSGETHRVEAVTFKLRGKYILPPEKLKMYSLFDFSQPSCLIRCDINTRYLFDDAADMAYIMAPVVSTTEWSCRDPKLAGGKGSSLATLTAIAERLDRLANRSTSGNTNQSQTSEALSFSVPPAVVLTVEAYHEFAGLPAADCAIRELLRAVESAQNHGDLGKLRSASEKCVNRISKVSVPIPLERLLLCKMSEVFGDNWEKRKLAVRSSAIDEDSEGMSVAGQLAIYLGVSGRANLTRTIVQCWASQFAFSALSYRRQFGQQLAQPMAIVIQAMVEPECAGVMFTCDPVSGNPGRVVITANFGLGESVVSALADPDTYSLEWTPVEYERLGQQHQQQQQQQQKQQQQHSRQQQQKPESHHRLQRQRRTLSDDYLLAGQGFSVTMLNKVCGAKERMTVQSPNGIDQSDVTPSKAQQFCLTHAQAIRVASIGVKVAEFTDNPCDIEWALVNGEVVLLQSRPVTSFHRASDFEMQHDMSSALFTDREILSRANLDEVTPGVFTPLSLNIVNQVLFDFQSRHAFDKAFARFSDSTPYAYTRFFSISRKFFINLSTFPTPGRKSFLESGKETLFGFDVMQHEAIKKGIFHVHKHGIGLRQATQIIKCQSLCEMERTVKKARESVATARIELPEQADSLKLLVTILTELPKFKHALPYLIKCTFSSSFYSLIAMNTLKQSRGEDELTTETAVILSKLLRSDHDIESASIPRELLELANKIRDDPKGSQLPEMSYDEALQFLQTDEGSAARFFRHFLQRNAHRCYKEMDISSKTWGIDPAPLVTTLQASVRAERSEINQRDILSLDDLENRPSLLQRRILNFVLPRAKYAVFAREATKSIMVKCIHEIRLAVRRLGQQLQAEGFLPDAELVYFLTVDELYRLITTRSPYILPKAIRRSRIHANLDREQYPVLLCGMPKPLPGGLAGGVLPSRGADGLSGTPVNNGVATGVARVIRDFVTEAQLIQKGDILVTRATDTGWTPYFPLLSGVVTEVGGLLSHGAVVAREYGLPAVVGVLGALDYFESGETVTVDGNRGVVSKSSSGTENPTEKPSHGSRRPSSLALLTADQQNHEQPRASLTGGSASQD